MVNTKFVQSDNIIWAKVDGWWQKYQFSGYNQEFLEWWVDDLFKWYDYIFDRGRDAAKRRTPHARDCYLQPPGVGRGDSSFHLNNAFKSITLLPKVENLD